MILQGYSADKQRQSLTYKGYDAVSKAYLSYAKSLFEKATTLSPFETSDDPVKNCLKVRESYQITLILKKGKRSFKIPSELINDYIEDECDLPLDRKTPYRLPFPAWVQEHIHVDHLKPVAAPTSEEFNYDHDSFIFRSSLKRHGTEADFTFEIKLLKDHIAVSEIPSYLEFKSKLDDLLPLKVEFEENETLVK